MVAGGQGTIVMKRDYSSPFFTVIEIENTSMLCSSSHICKSTANSTKSTNKSSTSNVYSSLTWKQKMAAMNLMIVFGGSCPGTSQNLDKINHIMTIEGCKMGVSGEHVHSAHDDFYGMADMVNTLKGTSRSALESLFWAYYCIVAVGKSAQAVQVLLGVYRDLGFNEQECLSILEKRTGRKLEDL